MNKDALLATLIGFGIGLLITGLLLVGPNILTMIPRVHLSRSVTAPTTPTPTKKNSTLTIESPLPDAIEHSSELLVSGVGTIRETVVITGSADETAVVVGTDRKFAGKVTLVEGKNDITVTAFSDKNVTTQSVTVYYTQESL